MKSQLQKDIEFELDLFVGHSEERHSKEFIRRIMKLIKEEKKKSKLTAKELVLKHRKNNDSVPHWITVKDAVNAVEEALIIK